MLDTIMENMEYGYFKRYARYSDEKISMAFFEFSEDLGGRSNTSEAFSVVSNISSNFNINSV